MHICTIIMKVVNVCYIFSLVLITAAKANETLQDTKTLKAVNVIKDKSLIKDKTKVLKNVNLSRQSISLWPNIEEDQDLLLLEQVLQDIEGGRGKSNKYKRMAKFMYPLFMGVLVAKIVLVPLLLKLLTAISASAVVMSKIALITTGLVALKWIFSGNIYDTKDRLEFIYPPTSSNGKPFRLSAGSFSLWDDQSWSDSDNQYVAVSPETTKQKYIPVNLKYKTPYDSYRHAYGGRTNGIDVGNSVKDLYYYSQHNYNNNNGKPFL